MLYLREQRHEHWALCKQSDKLLVSCERCKAGAKPGYRAV